MAFWDETILTEAAESKAFELIPAGKYEAKLINAEVKQTKNGQGYFLNCDFEITGPTRIGARVFQMITIHNSNRTAVTIGMGQLHQLAVAGGAEKWWESTKTVGSLEQAIAHCNTLHTALAGQKIGINVGIDVGRTKDDGSKYDDKNKINSFVKLAGTGTAPDMVVEDESDVPF